MFKNVDRVHGRFLQYAIYKVVVGIVYECCFRYSDKKMSAYLYASS